MNLFIYIYLFTSISLLIVLSFLLPTTLFILINLNIYIKTPVLKGL